MHYGMLTKGQFLRAVKAAAKTQAEIAQVLGISEAAVSGLYKDPEKGKPRELSYNEAVKLADYFGIDPSKITAAKLIPVLKMCLRHPPEEWTDHNIAHLADNVVYGLELLQYSSSIEPSQDAIDVAARAITDRLRRKPGEEDTSS